MTLVSLATAASSLSRWHCSGVQHNSYFQQHDCVRWCHLLCFLLVGFEATRFLSATAVGIFDRGRERHVRQQSVSFTLVLASNRFLFERWFSDIEQFRTHPLPQFLVTFQRLLQNSSMSKSGEIAHPCASSSVRRWKLWISRGRQGPPEFVVQGWRHPKFRLSLTRMALSSHVMVASQSLGIRLATISIPMVSNLKGGPGDINEVTTVLPVCETVGCCCAKGHPKGNDAVRRKVHRRG